MRRRGAAILPNAEASRCRPPIAFEPPFPLVQQPELWVVTTAPREQWSGAGVGWSEDGDGFHRAGDSIGHDAVTGTLLEPLGLDGDDVSVRVAMDDGGKLRSYDDAAALRLQSECYLGDGRNGFEIVAFTGMRLEGQDGHAYVYRMHGRLVRGAYGTQVREWGVGTRFARIDGAVCRIALPHRIVAARAQLMLKLVSVNAAGDADSIDDPADADRVPYDVQGTFYDSAAGGVVWMRSSQR